MDEVLTEVLKASKFDKNLQPVINLINRMQGLIKANAVKIRELEDTVSEKSKRITYLETKISEYAKTNEDIDEKGKGSDLFYKSRGKLKSVSTKDLNIGSRFNNKIFDLSMKVSPGRIKICLNNV